MPTIEEYRAKKLLTDKLRAQQAAYQGGDFDPMNVTRGSMGGTYQMPDIYQANFAGPLAKVAGSWLGGRTGAKADASEAEAEQIKQAALDEIMGAGGTMTPQQAIKLQELGIEINPADFMTKPKGPPAAGAVTQAMAAGVPATLAYKMADGTATPEELQQIQAAMDARREEDYKRKVGLKSVGLSGKADTANTPYEQAKQRKAELENVVLDMSRSPEERQAAQQALASLKAGGGTAGSGLSVREEKEVLALENKIAAGDGDLRRLEESQAYINSDKAKSGFGTTQKVGQFLINTGLPGAVEGGTAILDPEMAALNSRTLGFVLTDMQALGGSDSNEELRTLRSRYPNASNNLESARKLINEAARFKKIDIQSARLQAAARRNNTYDSRVNYYKEAERMMGDLGGAEEPTAPALPGLGGAPAMPGAGAQAAPAPAAAPMQGGAGGLDPAKAARLAELQRKKAEGTLQ